MSGSNHQPTSHAIRIELLDPTSGNPMQSWEFRDATFVSIGRSSERDIAIADMSVSRQHVELSHGDQGWTLVSLGRSGVIVDGQRIQTALLGADNVFRLGAGGPVLRALVYAAADAAEHPFEERMATMATTQIQVLMLDDLETRDRDEKVSEIVNSDFFRLIKEKAGRLRSRR